MSKTDLAAHSGAGLKTDGTLWTWGLNNNGMLGQNEDIRRSSPVQVPGTTWKHISFSHYNLLATKTDGTLWGWGPNESGQLAQNALNPGGISSPVQIPGNTWSIVGGVGAATKTDGTLWTWGGDNAPGKLGLNDRINRSSPTQVPGTSWADVKVHNKVIFANKSLS